MAFYEWRRFNFFNLNKNVDSGKLREALKEAQVTSSSSGHGNLVFGDNEGNIHLVGRSFHVNTFRAYEVCVILVEQLRHTALLVTVGEDEPGSTVLKVWNLDKPDHPVCVRVSRIPPKIVSSQASALTIHQNLNLLAIGFKDGSIILYRGDILRERSNKLKIMQDGNSMVTGLAFHSTVKLSYLFVSTTSSVHFYNLTTKDKETKVLLDGMGCGVGCSVLAESAKDTHFMIARDDAVYCYTPDGRGPCYAVEGHKIMVQWFRSYVVIVATDTKTVTRSTADIPSSPTNTFTDVEKHTVTVLDLQNKFLVFSAPMRSVQMVLAEWGSFYLLDGDCKLFHLQEKDLQSKLALLFKKNLYDVSIRIAKSHQYDSDGLMDIFQQYGDHLYKKGDHNAAIEQYIKTIGKLEPSYVIRKFLDSQHIDKLTTYLQALHKKGLASEDHTTLLLNCYTTLQDTEKLREFIMTKDREVDFDVEIAIKVCRQASPEDALTLAKKHKMHDWYLKIQLEDHSRFLEALDYISCLEFDDAEANLRKYGNVLLDNAPEETTQLLKNLCTDYKPRDRPLVSQSMLDGNMSVQVERAHPDDFIHLFLNNSERLVEFLEYLVGVQTNWSTLVYNTLLEHYLQVWKTQEGEKKTNCEDKFLKLLSNSEANYDRDHTLILCQINNFNRGVLYLYEESQLYQQIVQYHQRHGDYEAVVMTCRRFGKQDPSLWVQALWCCAKDLDMPSHLLTQILHVIEKEKLLSPLLVVDALASSPSACLGDVKNYLLSVLQSESELTHQEQMLGDKYRQETERIRAQINNIQTSTMIFQGSRCSACNHQLELPSIHFLCQHSYHQHCFQSFSESESECPACLPENKKILDIIKIQEQSRDLHETFHSQLERAEDGFSLVADYFSRGVFNKLTIIADKPATELPIKPAPKYAEPPSLRKVDKSFPQESSNVAIPRSEGRIRLEEAKRYDKYSSSLEANMTRPAVPSSSIRGAPSPTLKTKAPTKYAEPKVIHSQGKKQEVPRSQAMNKNPFEENTVYDETKNPFADDSTNPFSQFDDDSNNPFSEDHDDYDKNLNPFA